MNIFVFTSQHDHNNTPTTQHTLTWEPCNHLTDSITDACPIRYFYPFTNTLNVTKKLSLVRRPLLEFFTKSVQQQTLILTMKLKSSVCACVYCLALRYFAGILLQLHVHVKQAPFDSHNYLE